MCPQTNLNVGGTLLQCDIGVILYDARKIHKEMIDGWESGVVQKSIHRWQHITVQENISITLYIPPRPASAGGPGSDIINLGDNHGALYPNNIMMSLPGPPTSVECRNF